MTPHTGSRRAGAWPRWALYALMSGAQRASEDIWRTSLGESVQHMFDHPRKTPEEKARSYRRLARQWYREWVKNDRSLSAEASGPGPLSPLFEKKP